MWKAVNLSLLYGDLGNCGIWTHVLTSLAEHLGVKGQEVMNKSLIAPQVQWSQARNLWKNAAIRTVSYLLAASLRWVRKQAQQE